ncbi:uncharacterized protein LOC132311844 isoform X2 [Cornus florida]|nr:uncharacterized protein LOC132311844 isoform X2 [Cornus florida]XP_059665952.1 uncharacterized protein LOC132311844 isoform X2 [Cornus florida]
MVAVRSAQGNHFVKNLLELMSPEDVAISSAFGKSTALHYAARAGNIEAAMWLVNKNPRSLYLCNIDRRVPLEEAVMFRRRNLILYLLEVTIKYINIKTDGNFPIDLQVMIAGDQFDIALSLVQRHHEWARMAPNWSPRELSSALHLTILKPYAFRSGTHLNWWQRLIYSYVPMKLEDFAYHSTHQGDIENPVDSFIPVKQKLYNVFWKVTQMLVPEIKYWQELKGKHYQVLELVKHLCNDVAKLNYSEAEETIRIPLIKAASVGIPEVVEVIFTVFPDAIANIETDMGQNVFQVAIVNRCESVFNLIYQFREEARETILSYADKNLRTCLDLAACLESEQKLYLRAHAAGAALQMQRELQWFKEVEKFSIFHGTRELSRNKTPAMIFTETHEELVKEGEKWIKDTANSCTIVAALVATMVFAAAITVPGGNDDKSGLPILFKDRAFIIFIISDALALFSSTSSVLLFLSILTSRYAEIDFLYTLPKRLVIGLVTLFFSTISMMVAFSTTLYLVLGYEKAWIIVPVTAFSCIPVTLFASLQFPLLLDMVNSTCGPSIFGKQSDRILY